MNPKSFLQGPWFQRIVLLVWLVSSALVMFSQKTIDAIVNGKAVGQLYHYGLQPNLAWQIPYWTYARLLYATQFVCIALTAVALATGFLKKGGGEKSVPKSEQKIDKKAAAREETNGRNILISCPSCKRVFSKPLVMLDFPGGKAKLVNVCPYCNTVLGNVDQQDEPQVIVDPGKEVVQQERG